MVEGEGGGVGEPASEEGFVFAAGEGGVEGGAGGEDEVVGDGAAVVAEVVAGVGGLGAVVVGEEVGVETEVYFVEEDVVGAGLDY